MAWLTSKGSRSMKAATLLVALLLPAVAWAAWGDENWGEMIWGEGLSAVPSLSVLGQVALAILLLVLPGGMLLRHRRRARP